MFLVGFFFVAGGPNVVCRCVFLLGSGRWVGVAVCVVSCRLRVIGPWCAAADLVHVEKVAGAFLARLSIRHVPWCRRGALWTRFSANLSWRCVTAIWFSLTYFLGFRYLLF